MHAKQLAGQWRALRHQPTLSCRCAACPPRRLLPEPPLHPSQSEGRTASILMWAAPVGASLLASELRGVGRSELMIVGH